MEGQGLPKRKEAGVANKKLREGKKKKSFEKIRFAWGYCYLTRSPKAKNFIFYFYIFFLFVPCFGSGMLHSNILQYFMILLNLNI